MANRVCAKHAKLLGPIFLLVLGLSLTTGLTATKARPVPSTFPVSNFAVVAWYPVIKMMTYWNNLGSFYTGNYPRVQLSYYSPRLTCDLIGDGSYVAKIQIIIRLNGAPIHVFWAYGPHIAPYSSCHYQFSVEDSIVQLQSDTTYELRFYAEIMELSGAQSGDWGGLGSRGTQGTVTVEYFPLI